MTEARPRNERFLECALTLYACGSLIAMGPMSVTAVLFAACALGCFKPLDLAGALKRSQAARRLGAWTLALIVAVVLSLAAAAVWPVDFGPGPVAIDWGLRLGKLWYFVLPFLLGASLARVGEQAADRILNRQAWLFLGLSALGVVQSFTGFVKPHPVPGLEGRFHADMLLGHHLTVASVWIFPFFLNLGRTFVPPWRKGVTLGLGASVLLLTFSRTLWISFAVGVLVYAFLKMKRPAQLILPLAIAALGIAAWSLPAVRSRLTMIGVMDRVELWKLNWEWFQSRPWFGIGFRQNEAVAHAWIKAFHSGAPMFAGHAHNNGLEMLAGTGALGFAAFLGWNLSVFRTLVLQRALPLSASVLAAWVVFHLNGLTQVNFWEGKVMHQWVWALGWMLYESTRRQRGKFAE